MTLYLCSLELSMRRLRRRDASEMPEIHAQGSNDGELCYPELLREGTGRGLEGARPLCA